MSPLIRLAMINDVPAMHAIRLSVRENRLSSPARVTTRDYYPYIAAGSAWVAEQDGKVVGFAAAAAASGNVWALFVSPLAEGTGIGRLLHEVLLGWVSDISLNRLTLTTAAGTRAEGFYKRLGWHSLGIDPDGSIRFLWQVDQSGDWSQPAVHQRTAGSGGCRPPAERRKLGRT